MVLGLSEREFWHSTFRKLDILLRQHGRFSGKKKEETFIDDIL
ncbi:MAG: hypothetical protein Kow00111_28570 [Thermincola ferriacetica]